jgi:hypothetical protein
MAALWRHSVKELRCWQEKYLALLAEKDAEIKRLNEQLLAVSEQRRKDQIAAGTAVKEAAEPLRKLVDRLLARLGEDDDGT